LAPVLTDTSAWRQSGDDRAACRQCSVTSVGNFYDLLPEFIQP
jgi:hypothetical protein